ncbi:MULTISPECIES: LacI family DNA-binding transcriptional regulator [unclassified Microbacterium]|uniref:LacI family DNA-binding transcriptional regulator n=1 Tax=unclassified Microbacterium TaxID=2609290 RepID=UPI00214A8E25|nr:MULTISPECIES: LacI family DNA-binding transcriptional regulator [unclassified Microbacterium]MCR2786091.1 LacI family transcriptional regulator [Microbacterium sp. zg.B96]WIM17060.1 LacI family DNA-binding transcriptional regulator [Microbacterium sp. zg-B96]
MGTSSDSPQVRRVTAAEIARRAGVTAATVSYVMNGRPGVSDATRYKILNLAEELGYIPSALSVRLRSRHTRVIGAVLNDIAKSPFHDTEIAGGVIDAARTMGYEVFIANTGRDHSRLKVVLQAMADRGVDGILTTILEEGDADLIRSLRKAHLPYVQITRRLPLVEADFVGTDSETAATDLMDHLIGVHGYRDLVLMGGPQRSSASKEREAGNQRAAETHGVKIAPTDRLSCELSEADSYRATMEMLKRRRIPRAIVCGADVIAWGALAALRDRGLRVPADVAVTGFGGREFLVSDASRLTTLQVPRQSIAVQAVSLLINRISGNGGAYRSVLLPSPLKLGNTCGC